MGAVVQNGGNRGVQIAFHYRNGVPMRADGHHVHLSQDGSLVISNIQLADEGSYTCSAYSSSNSVSASTEVKVLRNRPSREYNLSSLLLRHRACLLAIAVRLPTVCPSTTNWGSSRSFWVSSKAGWWKQIPTRALGAIEISPRNCILFLCLARGVSSSHPSLMLDYI